MGSPRQQTGFTNTKIMKKLKAFVVSSLVAGSAVTAQAEMLAGWDFSQFTNLFDGFSSIDGATTVGSLDANYSDALGGVNGGASAIGTVFYDGTNGSTAFNLNTGEVGRQSGFDLSSNSASAFATLGSIGSRATLNSVYGQNGTVGGLGVLTDGNLVFEMDVSSTAVAAEDWIVTYGAQTSSGTGSITWAWSLDGVVFNDLASSNSVTAVDVAYSADFSGVAALDGQSSVFFRAAVDAPDGFLVSIDNVQISGTAVPEPSAFAALAGVVALGFVAVRRRK